MSRNVERIFTRLQALCDENFGQCQQDFVAHETWLCETFKANALQQLKSRKVELACPTSAKKQKKSKDSGSSSRSSSQSSDDSERKMKRKKKRKGSGKKTRKRRGSSSSASSR